MQTNNHPYDSYSKSYNFLIHPLHVKENKIFSAVTLIVLTCVTFGTWLIPFGILNRLDHRKVANWTRSNDDRLHEINDAANSVIVKIEEKIEIEEKKEKDSVANTFLDVNHTEKNGVRYLNVLNQYALPKGESTCGFHALKNALSILGYVEPNDLASKLEYEGHYSKFEQFVRSVTGAKEDDLSIAEITEGLHKLAEDSEYYVTQQDLSRLCVFLHPANSKLSVSGENDLVYISNLYTKLQQINDQSKDSNSGNAKPFVFVIGHSDDYGTAHWLTLAVVGNKRDGFVWYAADSNNKAYSLALELVNEFKIMFDKSSIDFLSMYKEAIGDDLNRKAAWIGNQDGKDRLLKDQEKYLPRVTQAYTMMEKMGWLDKIQEGEISMCADNVKKLKSFYDSNNS